MIEKFKEYIRKHHMIQRGDTIVAGVSGGADSVCLLCMLADIREEFSMTLIAVHVNHGLRAGEAERDQAYVESLCKNLGIPLEKYWVNVNQIARERKQSEEEAGRDIRREAFAEVLHKYEGQKIALAQHADDNAETMLLNLFRGTGIRGLRGIVPVAGVYVRPLLWARRYEIEAYLGERNISYCIDSTNASCDYTRNKIRHEILPVAEMQVNSKAISHMNDTMEQLWEIENYLMEETEKAYKTAVKAMCEEYNQAQKQIEIIEKNFCLLPKVVRARVVQKAIGEVAGQEKDIGKVHIKSVESLMEQQVGKEVHLPYNIRAKRTYEGVLLFAPGEDYQSSRKAEPTEEVCLAIPGVTTGYDGCQIECRVFLRSEEATFPEKAYTKWFDYDTIKNDLMLRTRRAGDRIAIYTDGKSQKLKDFFINEKVAQKDRDKIMLITDGNQVVWAVGLRMSSAHQISKYTNKVLEIRIQIDEGDN